MELIDRLYVFAAVYRTWLINAALVVLAAVSWTVSKAVRAPKVDQLRLFEQTYAAWRANPDEHSEELEKALAPFPAKRKWVQGEIAEWHLVSGRAAEAKEAVSKPLAILRAAAPSHAQFAEIGLAIARQEYQAALEMSVSLKEAMEDKRSMLYGSNLLRIALLQQEVGNGVGEWAAWKELEEFKRGNAKALAELLPKGLEKEPIGANFEAYIEERKKKL